jgi:hypothetical protein
VGQTTSTWRFEFFLNLFFFGYIQRFFIDYYQNFMNSLSITMEKSFDNRHHNTPEGNSIPPATGLLLIFPTLFVHSLEVTDSALKLILEDLNQSINNPNGLIREASILNISYNVYTFEYMKTKD